MSLPAHSRLLLDALPASRPLRVIDIGANPLSTPAYARLLREGGCDLVGFEPQDSAFAELEAQKGPRETYFRSAVGAGGPATLHVTRQGGFTSLYRPDRTAFDRIDAFSRASRVVDEVAIETTRLDDVDGLGPQDVLKIDVQGAERDIFESGPRVLSDVVAVIAEVRFFQLYEGEPNFADLDRSFRAAGLGLLKFLTTVSRRTASRESGRADRKWSRSQLIDGDAVYIRDLGRPEELTDDQLCHLALASDAIFEAPDVAAHCLDVLVDRGAVDADLPTRYMDHFVPAGHAAAAE